MNDVATQLHKVKTQRGFIAALDQSGGSTPNALMSYGIKKDAWSSEDEMFANQGLATEKDGVQLMKQMPGLAALLRKAKAKRIFRSKMRSLIKQANAAGIKDIVNQQSAQQSDAEYNARLDAIIQSMFEASNT